MRNHPLVKIAHVRDCVNDPLKANSSNTHNWNALNLDQSINRVDNFSQIIDSKFSFAWALLILSLTIIETARVVYCKSHSQHIICLAQGWVLTQRYLHQFLKHVRDTYSDSWCLLQSLLHVSVNSLIHPVALDTNHNSWYTQTLDNALILDINIIFNWYIPFPDSKHLYSTFDIYINIKFTNYT